MGEGKRKVLCILQLPPPVHGASVMNNYLVNSKLLNDNFNIEVINLQFAKSIKDISKFSISKAFKVFFYWYQIVKYLLFRKPDLVYFTLSPVGFAFYRDAFYIFFLKLFNRKIVYHLHGKGIRENAESTRLKGSIYKWVFKKTYVICLSESLVSDLQNVYKSAPYIVPNGILANVADSGFRKSEPPHNVPVVLFLSNYIKEKGVLDLIEALAIVKANGGKFTARLVGSPTNLTIEALEVVIENNKLSYFIKVLGPRYSKEKEWEFMNADLFIFPTYYKNEAFPLVILEALQYSLPVISTNEGGIPDIVTENANGCIVESRNTKMLADKILFLLDNNNLRRKMGENGREKFMKEYTLDIFETNVCRVFNNILNQG